MARKIQGYGWVPDLPDGRDLLYAAPLKPLAKLPPRVDLRPKCPPVYDQGQLGSCTANAIAGALEFDQMKQKRANDFTPSRLFIYYNERAIEGTVESDSGAHDPRRHQERRQAGRLHETHLAVRHREFRTKPTAPLLRRRGEAPGDPLPARAADRSAR